MPKTNTTTDITDVTTEKVADLIKIKIPASEIPNYTEQLSTVLQSVEVLQELDTEGVKETAQTHGMDNVLREDEAVEGLDMTNYKNAKNFKPAPDGVGGYFVVDKVI